MDDLALFGRMVEAVRPWLGELVIVGGWAHRLYRFHQRAGSPPHLPVQTKDADVALSLDARLEGNIAAALGEADFHAEFRGEDSPPVTQYRLGAEDQAFFVEFLTPLRGSGTRRDGTPDVTASMAGVTVQKLRHLDLLLTRPWTVSLNSEVTEALKKPAEVRIASPVTFIAQKLLIRNVRPRDKQAQDVLYIHDTLELFASDLESLKTEWRNNVRSTLTTSTAGSIERLCQEQFGAVTDVIRAASRIPADRTLAPDRLQKACLYGLEEIFGAE